MAGSGEDGLVETGLADMPLPAQPAPVLTDISGCWQDEEIYLAAMAENLPVWCVGIRVTCMRRGLPEVGFSALGVYCAFYFFSLLIC